MISALKSERKRVTFVGRINVGKSSLVNALLEQNLSIVSPIPGTTTDPTEKAIEILPAGPLLFTDTAGIDDTSLLGNERIKKVYEVLKKTDLMVVVIAPPFDNFEYEKKLLEEAKKNQITSVIVVNKIDMFDVSKFDCSFFQDIDMLFVSAKTKQGIKKLREYLGTALTDQNNKGILDGLVKENDHVLIITPVHHAYPKGRMKPLQVQVFREILDKNATFTVAKPEVLKGGRLIEKIRPNLIVFDSQALKDIKHLLPENIPVTSFSILFARYKANFKSLITSCDYLDQLKDGDKVAVIEACSHHRLEGDMGREVLPKLIEKVTGKKLNFVFFSGLHQNFNETKDVKFALHCGGCMLTERDMKKRQEYFASKNIPLTNYGIFIAKYHGLLNKLTQNLK